MSNNKQSSVVDFIYNELFIVKRWMDLTPGDIEYIFNKAREMHKEEQIDSLINGIYTGQEMYFSEHKIKLDDNSLVFCAAIAQHYYNETFGGSNE